MAMSQTAHWTLEMLDALPEDGNKYEVIHGELFVTPAPRPVHDIVLAILTELLVPYVKDNGLGRVHASRPVVQTSDSQVEPDLAVRPKLTVEAWKDAPLPTLIVEVASDSTRRRDAVEKRAFYAELEVPEYWMPDAKTRSIRIVRRGQEDLVVTDAFTWHPAGAREPLVIDVAALFREAFGD